MKDARGSRWRRPLRALAVASLAAVALGVGLATLRLDPERLRAELADGLEAATGRRVRIEGELAFALEPGPVLVIEALRLSTPAHPDLLRAAFARVSVAPLRLLRGELTPREVRLDSAVLQLDLAEFALRIEASELSTDWTGEAPALRGQARLRALRLERPAAEPVLVESGVLSFVLDPESLRASLADGRLHGGEAGAEIHVRPTGEGALFEGELALSNVDVAPLLRRVFGVSDMTGRGSLSARLTSRGATRSALLGALNGDGRLSVLDGRLGGAAQLATLRARIGGGEPDAPFQRLDGTFRIEDGVLESRDLDLVGPHARTRGALTYDLRSGASRTAWRRSGAP